MESGNRMPGRSKNPFACFRESPPEPSGRESGLKRVSGCRWRSHSPSRPQPAGDWIRKAWAEAEKAILSGDWDLVVLDEINYAISYGMLDPAKVVSTLARKPEMVHVILTGRSAHPTIVEIADTVTEMRQVKHAYEKGVMAQRGIEY